MTITPAKYFGRNFHIGASFLRASESAVRHEVGVERIMWGADYPHSEGSYPYSTEALAGRFRSVRPGGDCADAGVQRSRSLRVRPRPSLRKIGDAIGPTVAEVATLLPVEDYPVDSTCNAFDRHQVLRSW